MLVCYDVLYKNKCGAIFMHFGRQKYEQTFSKNSRNGFLKLNQIFVKSLLEESMLTEYLNALEGIAHLVLFGRTGNL